MRIVGREKSFCTEDKNLTGYGTPKGFDVERFLISRNIQQVKKDDVKNSPPASFK